MQVNSDVQPARLLCGQAVVLKDGTEGVYIGALGNGQYQIETAAGTRIVSRSEFGSAEGEKANDSNR